MSDGRAPRSVAPLRAAVLQMPHGPSLEANLAKARGMLEEAAAAGAGLALLPEYFFATFPGTPAESAAGASAIRDMLSKASAELGLVAAANLIERGDDALLNLGVTYEGGRLVLEQAKVHPMPREAAGGVGGGARLLPALVRGVPTGMLVCADVLYPEAARVLALQGAQVLLNPVMSPWRAEDDTKGARDALFIARAYDSGAFVLKAGGFRAPSGEPLMGVAGRSLIAAPWGLLVRAKDDFAEELLVADLDLERLARFRTHQATFPARRPEAYGGLV